MLLHQGFIETDMTAILERRCCKTNDSTNSYEKKLGQVEDIAQTAVFLAKESIYHRSSYIHVNGGMAM